MVVISLLSVGRSVLLETGPCEYEQSLHSGRTSRTESARWPDAATHLSTRPSGPYPATA